MKKDDINTLIGSRVKEARETAHILQIELAKALDYESATAISLIESGERKLRAEDLQKVAKFLNRDISYFLGQEQEPINLKVALRADKDLSKKDEDKILEFIQFVKQNKNGK